MTNLKILLKNNILRLINGVKNKKNSKLSFKGAIIFIVLAMIGIVGLSFAQSFSTAYNFSLIGLNQISLFNGCLVAIGCSIISSVMKFTGKQKSSDIEMLLSMPVKKIDIAFSKIITSYAIDFYVIFALLFPYLTYFLIYEGFNIITLLCGVFTILILPLFSVGISYIIDFILTRLFNKTRNSGIYKSIISVLVMFGVIGGMVAIIVTYVSLTPDSFPQFINTFPVISWTVNFIANHNALMGLYIILLCIIPFMLGGYLFSLNLGKTLMGTRKRSSSKKISKASKMQSLFTTLLKKEFKTYFSLPVFVVNSIIGPVLILGVTIFVCIYFKGNIGSFPALPQYLILGFCGMVALTQLSVNTISLEGKNLWILSSSPINTKMLFITKILPNILLVTPLLIVCSSIISIVFKLELLQIIYLFLIPILLNVLLSVLGIIINLLFPKLEFNDETQVVKNSLASFLSLFAGILLTALLIGVYYICNSINLEFVYMGIIVLVIYLFLLIISILFLSKNGKTLFNKLSN